MAYRRREFNSNQRVQHKSVNPSILGTSLRCTIIYMEPLVVQPAIGAVNNRGSLYATGRYLRVRKRVETMIIGLRGAFTLVFEADKKWHFGLHQLRLHVLHGLLLPAAATTTQTSSACISEGLLRQLLKSTLRGRLGYWLALQSALRLFVS